MKRKSYLSARPDLGWRVLMRAQDMIAPPFSIGLCGLSGEDTVIVTLLTSNVDIKYFFCPGKSH